MSPQALKVVEAALAAAGDGEFLFPGPGGRAAILSRSVSKGMERTREALRLAEVTVHDLRRTVGSLLTGYGVHATCGSGS